MAKNKRNKAFVYFVTEGCHWN